MMYIKVGDNYFKEFKSVKRGSGSQHFTTHVIPDDTFKHILGFVDYFVISKEEGVEIEGV